MQETTDIAVNNYVNLEDITIPLIDMKDIQLKPYNGKGIRLYLWNEMVRCDMDGKQYFTSLKYLKLWLWGKVKFCYFSDNFTEFNIQDRKDYKDKKEAEFKERIRRSLRG